MHTVARYAYHACCLLLLCCASHAPLLAQERPPRRFTLPPELHEVSGLYYAGPDSLWWHNDSGDAPVLYRTNDQGRILSRLALPALRHVDWEDICADDSGHLYIGDFGNNRSQRQDLCIYRYHLATGAMDSIRFTYPDQTAFPPAGGRSFDMEAFFWHRDSLHLFSKDLLPKSNFTTRHYVLSEAPGTQVALLRDSLRLPRRVVTGAAIDTATGTVAFVAYRYRKLLGLFPTSDASVFLFTDYPPGHYLRGKRQRVRVACIFATQYESIDFINSRYLYVASEKTLFIKPKVKRRRWQ